MYFMLFVFMEALVCLGITFMPTESASLLTLNEWKSGDRVQFVICCLFGFALAVFFFFQMIFACYKGRLLANIAEVVPSENKLAAGVTILLKAYRNARKIRKGEEPFRIQHQLEMPNNNSNTPDKAKEHQDDIFDD